MARQGTPRRADYATSPARLRCVRSMLVPAPRPRHPRTRLGLSGGEVYAMRARYDVAATAVAGVVGLSIAGGIVVRATGANLERGRLSAQQDAYRAQRDAAGTHCVWSDQTWWQPRYVLDGSDASDVAGCAALNSAYRAQHEAMAKAAHDAENQRAARQAADDAAA